MALPSKQKLSCVVGRPNLAVARGDVVPLCFGAPAKTHRYFFTPPNERPQIAHFLHIALPIPMTNTSSPPWLAGESRICNSCQALYDMDTTWTSTKYGHYTTILCYFGIIFISLNQPLENLLGTLLLQNPITIRPRRLCNNADMSTPRRRP